MSEINYVNYSSEEQMPDIMALFKNELSEPYSVYTYRYFINNWTRLCFMAYDGQECIGAIVCKLDSKNQNQNSNHNQNSINNSEPPDTTFKGYIAMLAVKESYRKQKIATKLVLMAIEAMTAMKADEIVLETQVTNKPALRLYENLGFVRDKRLFRYYLDGLDAFRLKLWHKGEIVVSQETN